MMGAYSRNKKADKALDISRLMRNKDTFSWNIIMHCLSENRRCEEALRLFIDLVRLVNFRDGRAKLNASIYTTALHICSVLALLELGRQIHARIVKDSLYQGSVFICNSLINMYSSSGATIDLEQVFDEMSVRDIISWISVIQGLGQNGLGKQALMVAERALEQKMCNGNTFIAILTSCSHAGLIAEGLSYFDAMTEKHGVERKLDHYICAIDLLGRAGRLEEAYRLLRGMPFAPNTVVWSTLLHSCLAHKNCALGSMAAQELRALQPDGGENYERLVLGCCNVSLKPFGHEKSANHVPGCSWVT
jgi:pentatricopeptide repeat protein